MAGYYYWEGQVPCLYSGCNMELDTFYDCQPTPLSRPVWASWTHIGISTRIAF